MPNQEIDINEIIKKDQHLKILINNLLLTSDVSSIQKITKNNSDGQVKELLDKAIEKKILGERLLEDEKYLEALVNFQASLEYILQAIRKTQDSNHEERGAQSEIREKLKTNEFFISTAARIVDEEENGSEEPRRLLEKAKAARGKAEAMTEEGKTNEALEALDESTSLARRAIILLREGKTIERRLK